MEGKEPQSPRSLPQYLSVSVVARLLEVSQATVRRWIARGELDAIRINGVVRVAVDELAVFIERHRCDT